MEVWTRYAAKGEDTVTMKPGRESGRTGILSLENKNESSQNGQTAGNTAALQNIGRVSWFIGISSLDI